MYDGVLFTILDDFVAGWDKILSNRQRSHAATGTWFSCEGRIN